MKRLALKFYLIDSEILFSRAPFLLQNTEEFSFVLAPHSLEFPLESNVSRTTVPIPADLVSKDMVIEVR